MVKFATRLRVSVEGGEELAAVGQDMAAERIEPARQRPVGMYLAALGTKEDAGAILVLRQDRSLTVQRPGCAKFTRGLPFGAAEPGHFVGIELDLFMSTAKRAASANVAEFRGP